ncbi:MAG: hypothetical protein JWL85_673 [Candidatus Saccharibacteria bacterium]|nr:hypothetical protein [Candidatus Saccharibacteria bacterium]
MSAELDRPDDHPLPGDQLPVPGALNPEDEQRSPWRERIGNVLRAAGMDYQESPHKLRTFSAGVGTVALQAVDRARGSIVFVPAATFGVLEHTQSPALAGLTAAATFGAWCAAVGSATAEGLHHYPGAVSEFNKSFPGVVGLFEDALPGVNTLTPEQREASTARRIGRRLLTGLSRGNTVMGIGTVAYVSTAAAQGRPRSEVHRLNLNSSLDGGAIAGTVGFGLGEIIIQTGRISPAVSETLQDYASNTYVWLGLAGLMMAGQLVSTRIKKLGKSEATS